MKTATFVRDMTGVLLPAVNERENSGTWVGYAVMYRLDPPRDGHELYVASSVDIGERLAEIKKRVAQVDYETLVSMMKHRGRPTSGTETILVRCDEKGNAVYNGVDTGLESFARIDGDDPNELFAQIDYTVINNPEGT